MNLAFTIFSSFSIFQAVFVTCQRLQSFEMLKIIKAYPNIWNSSETQKCLPAIEGKYHPEIHYEYAMCDSTLNATQALVNYVYNVGKTECVDYQCWESILTDVSKFQLLAIFNTYRQTVARGTCNSWCENNKKKLVFRLVWDHLYEYEAASWLNDCRTKSAELPSSFPMKAKYLDEYLHRNCEGEVFQVTFKVETGFQSEFRAKLLQLLDGNYLSSWDEKTKQFKRGLANRIGCVYIVRYAVNLTTDLNEKVQSGYVAHFGCFIAAYFSVKNNPPLLKDLPGVDYSATTSENCAKVVPDGVVRPNSLYPSLCMQDFLNITQAQTPSMICQPDAKYHGAAYKEVCGMWPKSKKNSKTWDEKTYGYFIRWSSVVKQDNKTIHVPTPECNIPELPNLPKPKPVNVNVGHPLDFDCTRKQEVKVLASSEACSEWSCDDSQLTDETRQYVLNSLNTARHYVAQGLCSELCRPPCNCNGIKYCNIMKLRWHWYLESEAAKIVQNCTTEYYRKKTSYDNSYFQKPVFYEEVGLIFDLPAQGQIKLTDKIKEIFWTNGLHDWNTMDGTFRRGNAAFIGCAIVIRPGQKIDSMRQEYKIKNGVATHMVCIYASLDVEFVSEKGPPDDLCCPTCAQKPVAKNQCRLRTVKLQEPFPYLCSSISLLEITMSCAINNCSPPHHQSHAWKLFVEGETNLEHRNDTIEHIHRPSPENFYDWYMGHVYRKKNCRILVLLFLVTLSVLCLALALFYKHFVEKKIYTR